MSTRDFDGPSSSSTSNGRGSEVSRPADRDALERRADVVRFKLKRTLEALDKRRHDAVDVRLQVRRHVRAIAVLGGGLLALVVGGAALYIERAPSRAWHKRHERWAAARRLWNHPERLTRAEDPVLTHVVRRVAAAVLTAMATELVRRTFGLAAGKPRRSRSRALLRA